MLCSICFSGKIFNENSLETLEGKMKVFIFCDDLSVGDLGSMSILMALLCQKMPLNFWKNKYIVM
jgi:hypothetical protein